MLSVPREPINSAGSAIRAGPSLRRRSPCERTPPGVLISLPVMVPSTGGRRRWTPASPHLPRSPRSARVHPATTTARSAYAEYPDLDDHRTGSRPDRRCLSRPVPATPPVPHTVSRACRGGRPVVPGHRRKASSSTTLTPTTGRRPARPGPAWPRRCRPWPARRPPPAPAGLRVERVRVYLQGRRSRTPDRTTRRASYGAACRPCVRAPRPFPVAYAMAAASRKPRASMPATTSKDPAPCWPMIVSITSTERRPVGEQRAQVLEDDPLLGKPRNVDHLAGDVHA